uniref:IF rod domain-containing protein n=1 Tax=Eptatretus burgeri TaxID=7764 RepID=A0A8C4QNA2_EPTBU
MDALRKQMHENNPSLNVEVQQSPSVDLTAMIADVRSQYETMIQKNRDEAEASFMSKLDRASSSSDESNALMERTKEEYSKVRQQFQGVQVELETLRNMNIALEETLKDTGVEFDCDIKGLQASIDHLEAELCDVRSSISQQLCEHEALLNAKMKLEMEIATYRRLIEAEEVMNGSSIFTSGATDLSSNPTSSYISSISTDISSSTIKSGSRFSYSGSSGGHSSLPTNLTANTSVTSGGGPALVVGQSKGYNGSVYSSSQGGGHSTSSSVMGVTVSSGGSTSGFTTPGVSHSGTRKSCSGNPSRVSSSESPNSGRVPGLEHRGQCSAPKSDANARKKVTVLARTSVDGKIVSEERFACDKLVTK